MRSHISQMAHRGVPSGPETVQLWEQEKYGGEERTAFALGEKLKIVEHQPAEGDSVSRGKCIEDGERRSGRSRRGARQCPYWYPYGLIERMVDSVVQIRAYSTVNGCVPTDA